jgi:hypothetical protein
VGCQASAENMGSGGTQRQSAAPSLVSSFPKVAELEEALGQSPGVGRALTWGLLPALSSQK